MIFRALKKTKPKTTYCLTWPTIETLADSRFLICPLFTLEKKKKRRKFRRKAEISTKQIQELAGPETGAKTLYSSWLPQVTPKPSVLRKCSEWLTLHANLLRTPHCLCNFKRHVGEVLVGKQWNSVILILLQGMGEVRNYMGIWQQIWAFCSPIYKLNHKTSHFQTQMPNV